MSSPAYSIKAADVTYLDELFHYPDIIPVSASILKTISQQHLSLWCLSHGIYQVPTIELIQFLRSEIGEPAKAMEIGAGNGCIGRALGIRMTDSYQQKKETMKAVYSEAGQPPVTYGRDVTKADAEDAVRWFKPKVVLGCWVTQKWLAGVTPDGNQWGIDEVKLMNAPWVAKYIVTGNQGTHGAKRLFNYFRPVIHTPDWLYSRSLNKHLNSIYIVTK